MSVTQICPYLRIQYKYIGYNRPHPLYCPRFLQCQHKIGQISCPVEGGARILEVRILEVRILEIQLYSETCANGHLYSETTGSFHVISTQKKPDLLGFLQKLVTIRYLVSDDATPILGSPHQVFLDLWPVLCGQFFTNFADLKCLNTHNSIILKS